MNGIKLNPRLQQIIREEGLEELTSPQLKAIPEILKGNNCLLIAPTGMGKTEAALLPIFNMFLNRGKAEGTSIIYITPLRALNRDMLRRTLSWGKKLDIDIAVRHGDTTKKERRKQSLHPPDMLITTPETLQILFTGKNLRESLKDVKWVVVDEIHELAGEERGAQLAVALERLKEIAGNFQRVGLSATVGTPADIAKFFGGGEEVEIIEENVGKEMEIEVKFVDITEDGRKIAAELGCDAVSGSVVKLAGEMIESHESVLLFVNTRDTAELLAAHLHEMGLPIEIHHGSLSREARIEAEEKFKEGKVKALICTSSLELGIDVGSTDFVIQYNSPRQVTRIMQRVGRSGHYAGGVARGVILATNTEDFAESMVIARRAVNGELEKTRIRDSPLAVLANQILAIAMEYGKIEGERVYGMIKRAYPFRNLDMDTFREVLSQLEGQRVIWSDGITIGRKRKTRDYFFENISMIPDEKSVDVYDISSNRKIGKLDESFVIDYCTPGAKFIMKGRAWEVVKNEEKLVVSPARKTYMVPDWAGEEIPVPFEVAQEVGRARRLAAEGNAGNEIIEREVKEQIEKGFVMPTDKLITIEWGDGTVYINTHFGSMTNEAVGRLIAALLAQRLGESIAVDSDAYRIYLRSSHPLNLEMVKEVMLSTNPDAIEDIMRVVLKNSTFIKWEMVKVARKFGVLSKDVDSKKLSLERIMEVFEGLPLVREVVERVIWEKMDMEHAKHVLKKIQDGSIAIKIQDLSPFSLQGEKIKGEIFRPAGFDPAILSSLKKRLMETRITLKCMNCSYERNTTVGRAEASCPRCRGRMVAVSKGEKIKGRKVSVKSASLVASYGKRAIVVMAGYGIGPDTAARILGTQKEGDELLKEILKAEINYSRTRQFWD